MAGLNYPSIFQWQDYVVLSVMLLISSAIGLFFGIQARRKKQATACEMLTGNKRLPMLPVALSLGAGFTSATTILGVPAEVFFHDAEIWLWTIGVAVALLFVAFVVIPVFYRLELTNAYEYLELRFNKPLRYAGSLIFAVNIFLYMAAVLFAPAVALSQVTQLSPEFSILLIGLVCTFYTAIGGIRAVVWTDALQMTIIWTGLLVLMFKGAHDGGGWIKVWEIARNGSRLPRYDFDPDPRIRHTFWSILFGTTLTGLAIYGGNQINLQRYSSVGSMKDAQIALILNMAIWCLYLVILCLLGLVMYATFYKCGDPLKAGVISQPDQLFPLFVFKSVGSHPGLPGLFVATIFSASISTLSSGINSMAAITLEDVIKPIFRRCRRQPPGNSTLTIATIVLVILYGLATIGMTFALDDLGKTALMISFRVFGMVGAPLVCLILIGLLLPCVNSWGAGTGLVSSLIACLYFGLDPILNPPPKMANSHGIHQTTILSDNANFTTTTGSHGTISDVTTPFLKMNTTGAPGQGENYDHFQLSYMHLSTVAFIVSPVVAILVSALTGCNKGRHVDERTYYSYSFLKRNKESADKSQTVSLLKFERTPVLTTEL